MARSHEGGPLAQAAAEAVRRYLDALRAGPPPLPHPSKSTIQRRLAQIDTDLVTAPPVRELKLVQERQNLRGVARWYELEDAFVAAVRPYSRRHGITYETWRAVGVPAALLRRAGIRPHTAGGARRR